MGRANAREILPAIFNGSSRRNAIRSHPSFPSPPFQRKALTSLDLGCGQAADFARHLRTIVLACFFSTRRGLFEKASTNLPSIPIVLSRLISLFSSLRLSSVPLLYKFFVEKCDHTINLCRRLMQTRSMIHVTHLRLDSNMVTMRLYFWKFYSITSFNLASEGRAVEDSTNYPFVHQSMYPVFLGEKARHRRSPIELRSISLPLIRKINSLERRNLVPEEETRHARTHARARTAAARKKGREAKRSKAALSLLLEEPANEPQGFAQRLPG